jgi:hypothetical protein
MMARHNARRYCAVYLPLGPWRRATLRALAQVLSDVTALGLGKVSNLVTCTLHVGL